MLGLFNSCSPKIPGYCQRTPESYEYAYSGTMASPIFWYRLSKENDGTLALRFSQHTPEITVYRAPDDALEVVKNAVLDYKLYKMKHSYMPPFEILDGYGWHMYIDYGDEGISSGGSNAAAEEQFEKGVSAIHKYLYGIVESATEGDIIGHEMH